MKVFNDLKTRGVNDILIAVTGGLTGMEAALEAVFPRTTLQRNADWGTAAHHWKPAMNQFAILYDDRFNVAG
jgi:transposase-like protein